MTIEFPTYSYENVTDLITAIKLPGIKKIIDDLARYQSSIDMNQTLQQLSSLETAALGDSRKCSCYAKVRGIIQDATFACQEFVDSSLTALQYHVKALKLAETDMQTALKTYSQCVKIALKIQKLSKLIESKVDAIIELTKLDLINVLSTGPSTLSLQTLGRIKTALEEARIFWARVGMGSTSLQDNETATYFVENGLKEHFIEEIKYSGISWLSLGKINHEAITTIQAVNANAKDNH